MNCREPEPCGQTPCEALTEIQWLLPKGQIWRLDEGRNFTKFWSAMADAKSCLMAGICKEWLEANPCTSDRTLSKWARLWSFPVDCVELTTEKLCEWIEFISSCGAGTEGFILGLLDFVGFDMTGIEVKFPDCCNHLFGSKCGSECGLKIVFCGPFDRFDVQDCDCTWGLFKTIKNPCGYVNIREVECLRNKYFPAGVQVTYEPDCDPNLVRHLRST